MTDYMEQEPALEPARGNIYLKHYIGVNAINFDELKGIISMDPSGILPITSERRNAYTFVMLDFDSNSILDVPIKNRTKQSLVQGYKDCLINLTRARIK